jgi:diguanylate cyclase (GGDEF)-like protein/PAS domain S-box-containing protein
LRANPTTRHTTAPDDLDVDALAKLGTASSAIFERDVLAKIATLEAQALRYETAIDKISQGVCFFDGAQRLILCNRRYAEIYRLTPESVLPGTSLREIADRRFAIGTCPMSTEDYLKWCASINLTAEAKTWTSELKNGRTIHICHQPMPDGGWVATHEDITELRANRTVANERISLQTLIDWVPDYLWVKDKETRFVVVNKALASDSGRATSDMIGLTDFDLHPPDVAGRFRASEEAVLASGQPMVDREETVVDALGVTKWLSSTKVPVRNDHGEIFGLVGIAHDITARKRADALRDGQARILEMIATSASLEDVLEHLMRLIESQLVGILGSVMLLDPDGEHLRLGAAPSLAKTYTDAIEGLQIGPKAGSCGTAAFRRQVVVVADIMRDPLWDDYRDLAAAHGHRSCWSTPILSHRGGVLGVLAMYSATARDPVQAEMRLIETATRIAGIAIERKLAEEQVHFLAHHDALTGLPNRILLIDRLSQAILHAQRDDRWVTVVFADLDNFKLVNDSLGHNAGDDLLKTVAGRMTQSVRATDTVVRLGGDEFVILLVDQAKNAGDISTTIEKVRASVAEAIFVAGQSLQVTCSMGIATFPQDGEDAEALLRNADTAMYQAKALGRDNFQFFTDTMNTKVHERLSLREEMRTGLARSEFHLVYQPQVDLHSGQVFAVEALVRWQHPTLGLVSPTTFIPLAEESGLIVPLGDWVLHEACRQNKAWQDAGVPPVNVCVNVSARQFRDKIWISRVTHALAESGLEPKYLELELTESLLMHDVQQAIATMKELQALGVQFAIDDFGTGYSSLSALKNFPVARLKIDQSFIRNLPNDEDDRGIAAAVISLGQKLNMRVIAEGVENDEQLAFLRDNQCDEIQGYHFSRPIKPGAIEELLRRGSLVPRALRTASSSPIARASRHAK